MSEREPEDEAPAGPAPDTGAIEVEADAYLPEAQPLYTPRARALLRHLEEVVDGPRSIDAALGALSGEGLLLLRLLCEIGRLVPLGFVAEEGALLLGEARCSAAFEELARAQLLVGEKYYGLDHAGVPRAQAEALLPSLPPLDEPRPGPSLPPRVPAPLQRLPFELALLVVALWTVRPKRTMAGPLYRRDEDRLQGLLGAGFPLMERLGQLQELGLCGGEEVLQVSAADAAQLGQLGPAELVRRFAAGLFRGPRQPVLSLLLSGAAEGKPAAWFAQSALERALRIGYLQRGVYFHRHANLRRSAADELARLAQFVGLERQDARHDGAGEPLYRLWPLLPLRPQAPPSGAVHLQPSFEIYVPPDAPPATLLELGRVTELKKVDQVVTLQLGRGAVARAADSGLSADDIIAALRAHAAAGVPQNIEAQVRGWAGQAGQARFAEGLVLVVSGEADRLVRVDPGLGRLLGPRVGAGLYLVPPRNRAAVEKRLRAIELPPAEGVTRIADEDDAWQRAQAPGRRQVVQASPAARSGPVYERAAALRARLVIGEGERAPLLSAPADRAGPAPPRPAAALAPAPRPAQLPAPVDEVPAALRWAALGPQPLELALRAAIRDGQPVYLQLLGEESPWAVQPQRISHRGRRTYLEAYRGSVHEYRVIPLENIARLGLPADAAEP